MDNGDLTGRVFKKVKTCLDNLVGGSGHLAAYSVVGDTFRILRVEELGDGLTRYDFGAQAFYESEFTVYSKEFEPETVSIEGSIVLDEDFNLTRDEKGRVRLEPWTCIDPESIRRGEKGETSGKGDILTQEAIDSLLGDIPH